MKVKIVVNYTDEEIHTMIGTLKFLCDVVNSDVATAEMRQGADTAFEEIAKLVCLDEKGEKAYTREGW